MKLPSTILRRPVLTVPAAALLALGVFALIAAAPTPSLAADGEVTILYNGSVRGELDDCGCPSRPLGGLARRAHTLEKLRSEHPDALLLDAGSLFGDPTADTAAQSRFLAEQTAELGYEIVGVGPYEIGHGVDLVRQVAASTGLSFVSANVTRGGDLLFEPYRIVERDGTTIAVTSVFDPEYLEADFMAGAGDVQAVDAVKAMKTWLPEMDAKADVVVVLTGLKQTNTLRFLRALHQSGHTQIDLVVDAIYNGPIEKPRRFGPTRVVAANNRGKHVGQIDLVVEDGAVTDARNTIHYLDVALPEDATVAARVKDFRESTEAVAGTK